MDTGWYCSQCGRRDGSEIALYQNGGMFNAHSKRLDPRCRVCGTLVVFHKNGHSAEATHLSSKVLIVNGTCASGKTTISYLMSEHYDFVQVDGDWVLEREKLRRKQPVNGDDIHHDLIDMVEGLVFLGKSVVLAHIIPPEFLPLYEERLKERQIGYRIVILMPQKSVVLSRNKHRKCWPKTTPEYWVTKFHEAFANASEEVKTFFYDNSHETPEETTENIFKSL